MKAQALSIVIPVYNGAHSVPSLVERLTALLENNLLQIVLVNDGSPDNSHDICRDLAARHPELITYLNLSKNFGEHNAVMAGLAYARGDYAVIMDDDFQNPPEEVLRLVEAAVRDRLDVVYGVYRRKQHSLLRNLGSFFNNWIATFMLGKPRRLYLSSFKCLSRFMVDEIVKYTGPFPYIDGLIFRATRNIGAVTVEHQRRREGHSGYTLRKLIRLWLNMFTNFSINPLRLSSLLGFIFSGLGMVMSVLVLIEKITHPDIEVGWPSLIIVIMVFSGVQLVILGLLGEYLGRLFLGSNQTPQYIIRDVVNGPTP